MAVVTPSDQTRRLIVVSGGGKPDDGMLAGLRGSAKVEVVPSVEAALTAARDSGCDAVVIDGDALLKLCGGGLRLPAETILEHMSQGVCVADPAGRIVWRNARIEAYPPQVVAVIQATCTALAAEVCSDAAVRGTRRAQRLVIDRDHCLDLTASAVCGADGSVEQFIVLVWDATATQRLQEKINAIDAAGRELMRLDPQALAQLDVGDRLALLEEKLLRLSHDLLHFDHLVVRVLDRQTNRLDTVLAGGLSEAAKDLEIRAEPEGQGITGHVAATGRSYICPDISKDPRYLPGLDNARSSVTVPLWLYDQVVGTLNVESDQIAAFGEEDRQYAEILGRYLAMALNLLKLLAVERSTTTDKLAADVASELATPLNDIVSETTRLLESHGGDDEVKRRAKVVLDSVERARRVLRSVSEHHGVTGLAPERPDRDGLLAGKTILVADDEDIIRETVSEVLTQHGARVLTARDGSDAAALIRAEPHVDLVLSDIKMPGKNGYEIFAAVRLAHPTCPVILITGFGYDPNHSIVRAGKEGLAGVLFKPFKVEQMLDEVRTALQPKALR